MLATIARPLPVVFAAIVEDAAFDEAILAEIVADGILEQPEYDLDLAALYAAAAAPATNKAPACLACGDAPAAHLGLCAYCLGTEPTPPDGGGEGGPAAARRPSAPTREEGLLALRTFHDLRIALVALDNGSEMLASNLARMGSALDSAQASVAFPARDWSDEEIHAYWEAREEDPAERYDLEDVA